MENLILDELELNYTEKGNQLIMEWLGKSTLLDPSEKLIPYFDENIAGWKGKELIWDVRRLEYINSVTVSSIIYLIKKLNDNAIKTTMLYDKNSKWQYLSFHALGSVITTLKCIKIEGVV